MSRVAAKFTQSDACRIFKAARNAGVEVEVVFRRNGDIVATTGKLATANSETGRDDWDEYFDAKENASARQ